MKYIVVVDGTRVEVEREGDTVRVDGGASQRAELAIVGGSPVMVLALGGEPHEVHRVIARRDGARGRYVIALDGRRFGVEALDERTAAIRALSRASAGPEGPRPLVAPMPGLVVRVTVAAGDRVEAGQGLVVMEAMKMENELRAPAAGVVKKVLAQVGAAVEKGAVLVQFE
ncbi:MAG: biotin/lipoyl-containing protein [Gemmatimonadales bacterium]